MATDVDIGRALKPDTDRPGGNKGVNRDATLVSTPNTATQIASARRTVARHAHNRADLAALLDVLGLEVTHGS